MASLAERTAGGVGGWTDDDEEGWKAEVPSPWSPCPVQFSAWILPRRIRGR
jgi:hypothetical protein